MVDGFWQFMFGFFQAPYFAASFVIRYPFKIFMTALIVQDNRLIRLLVAEVRLYYFVPHSASIRVNCMPNPCEPFNRGYQNKYVFTGDVIDNLQRKNRHDKNVTLTRTSKWLVSNETG